MYLISNGWISASQEYAKKVTDALNKVLGKKVSDEYVRHNDLVIFYIEDEETEKKIKSILWITKEE